MNFWPWRHVPTPPRSSTPKDLWAPVPGEQLRVTTPTEILLLAQRDAALQALNDLENVPLLLDQAIRLSRTLREAVQEIEEAVERIRAAKDRLDDTE